MSNSQRPETLDYNNVTDFGHGINLKAPTLVLESPPWVIVAEGPVVQLAHLLDFLGNSLPLRVLLFQYPVQKARHYYICQEIAQGKAVPDDVSRSVIRTVQLCAQDCTAISNRDLHSVCNSPFRLAGHVDSRPGQSQGCGWVNPTGGEECPQIVDPRSANGIGVCEQNDVAYRSESS